MTATLYQPEIGGIVGANGNPAGQVKHIALFQFRPESTPTDIEEVWRVISDLPKTIPRILDFGWGPDASVEGRRWLHAQLHLDLREHCGARCLLGAPDSSRGGRLRAAKLAWVIVIDHVVSS